MHPWKDGLHSCTPVFSAVHFKCGYSYSSATRSSENEVKSETDGSTAGGEAGQKLPGKVFSSQSWFRKAGLSSTEYSVSLQVPSGLTLSTQADDLDGLSSIITVLEGYNSLISDTLNGTSQVKVEISSLTGFLHQWRHGHCAQQQAKVSVSGPLQELQRRKQFIHTVSIEALMRVKEVLRALLKNLENLGTC